MIRIIIYEAVFILSFAAGIILTPKFKDPIDTSRRLFMVEIYCLETLIYVFSMWKLDITVVSKLFKLFVSYGALIFAMMVVGYLGSRLLRQTAVQRGAFVNASAYSNIGIGFGGVVCFLILGETGIALANICVLSLILVSFTVGMFLSSYWGQAPKCLWRQALVRSFKQPLMWSMIGSLGAGILLNYAGVTRPVIIDGFMSALVILSLILTTFAIGLGLRFADIFACPKAMAGMYLIKFIITPIVALLISMWFLLEGHVRSVMLVESIMPCAVTAVMLSRLFGHDHRMANAMWLGTTVGGLFIIPIIIILGWHRI